MERELDVLIIGAGQAGLAAGYWLKERGLSVLLVDKGSRAGEVWRTRYDSLKLFTPRWYSSLPGLPLEGEAEGFATKDEIADYLAAYAEQLQLPVQYGEEVKQLSREAEGFRATTQNGNTYQAKQIIIATGPFQQPFLPQSGAELAPGIMQLHSASYRNAGQLQDGPVLVVGGGNSGAQIAVELAERGDREVLISVGHPLHFMPLVIGGRSIFTWFRRLGLLTASKQSLLGRVLSKRKDPIFGKELKALIQSGRVVMKPRLTQVDTDHVWFEDGSHARAANVLWATGFRSDYSWVDIPEALDAHGAPKQQRGISPVEGLYYVGLPWQHARGSALLGGVGTDAAYVVQRLLASAR
jgi:putative flavoprotein involved in K+ transport